MASRSERTRNNVKAGIFASAGIILAFAVVIILGDVGKIFVKRTPYVLRFPLAAGVEGLIKGAPVRIGGLERGRVVSVTPEEDHAAIAAMRVAIELDSAVALYPDAKADRIAPLLGGISAINFSDVGDPSRGKPLTAGSVIQVDNAAGGALRRILGDESAERVASIVKNLDETLAAIKADYAAKITPALDQLDAALADARELVASVKRDYPGWSEKIGNTLGNVESASAKFDPLLDDARGAVDDIRGVVRDNRTRIDELLENVRAASGDVRVVMERTKNEIVDRVVALLDRGSKGLETFTALGTRLNVELDAASPQLDRILADARMTAQQLKLASIEVRRSPWKLLYRPSDKELDNELLYDAARSFALAAGDLESTSETIDRVLTRDAELLRADPTQAQRIRSLLGDSLKKFEDAQQRLFTILLESGAKER